MNQNRTNAQGKPLITFVIPCYNSASYMHRSIESLLDVSQSCEILIINDGSQDDTGKIAHEYAATYENIVAIDQNNSNWGGVVNHGLKIAQGLYFKVLDSDDYFDKSALHRTLDALAHTQESDKAPDLLITNYVYDHLSSRSERVMQYRSFFPIGRVFTWDEMSYFKRKKIYQDKFIMIHSAWFKTAVLRESNVHLQENASYMDSMLLLHPLPFVKNLFYLDTAPYHYLIGREGQSVEIEIVKKHIDEQILASRLAIDDFDYAELYRRKPSCAMLMTGYISCMMSVSTLHLFMIGTSDAIEKNRLLWSYLAEKNPALYANVKKSWAGRANRKTRLGRFLARSGFSLAQKIYKFA